MASSQQVAFAPLYSNLDSFWVKLASLAIPTSGAPVDLGSVAIPGGAAKWRPLRAMARCSAAGATLAAGTIALFTQAAGAGTAIVAAVALTGLTAPNTIQDLAIVAQTTTTTDLNIFCRLTVASLNVGTVDIWVEVMPCP